MNVGERIKYFREKKKLTVNGLANLAGVSQSYLRDLELGNKQPTVEYLSYICEALGITLAYFFTDEKTTDELTVLLNRLTSEQKQSMVGFLKTILKD